MKFLDNLRKKARQKKYEKFLNKYLDVKVKEMSHKVLYRQNFIIRGQKKCRHKKDK